MATPSGDGGEPGPKRQPHTLRQAASAVFALTAILPLLLFVWTVHHLGALSKLPAQLGLGLALAVALLGFCIFRRLMGQMSDLIVALRRVVEHGERSAARTSVEAPGGAPQPAAETRARGAVSPAPASRPPAEPALLDAAEHTGGTAPPHAPATPGPLLASPTVSTPAAEGWSRRAAETDTVPGLGAIQEVHDLSRAMAVLWQAEAAVYKGQRVVVSVLNAAQPTIGTLIGLTDDGLLLQTEDGSERVAVGYSRISAIDATESSAS
jgi:hypothetical protein